jgi:hypothetical protein
MKMNRRHQISRKVGILGACRRLLLLAVRPVKEEEEDCRYSQDELPWHSPLDRAYSVPDLSVHRAIPLNGAQIPTEDALRVKSAEFWLKLGEVDEVSTARLTRGGFPARLQRMGMLYFGDNLEIIRRSPMTPGARPEANRIHLWR